MKKFWNTFEAKEFSKAQQEFVKLSSEEQTTILGELF